MTVCGVVEEFVRKVGSLPVVVDGCYKMESVIAVGGYGAVYQAVKDDKIYAIKVVSKAESALKGRIDCVAREVEMMMRINHPGFVRLHDAMETDDFLFIVMEYVDGCDLYTYLEGKRLANAEARKIMHQLVPALETFHEMRMGHRDLKLENVLYSRNGVVKIADFGLAVHLMTSNIRHTKVGSMYYQAPEVETGNYDALKADVWSIGVILFILLTGHYPFMHGRTQPNYNLVPVEKAAALLRQIFVPEAKRITICDIRKSEWFQDGYVPIDNPVGSCDGRAICSTTIRPIPFPVVVDVRTVFDVLSMLAIDVSSLGGDFYQERLDSLRVTSKGIKDIEADLERLAGTLGGTVSGKREKKEMTLNVDEMIFSIEFLIYRGRVIVRVVCDFNTDEAEDILNYIMAEL